jgi:ADP-ribosylglycohydrolase
MAMMDVNRYRGCLMGLAVGDALGTTLEFKPPGTFSPITDIVGGGPFGLEAGQWTDDTSMALCLAESLVEKESFDLVDQMERYVRWFREGHLSSIGSCFDIGNTIRGALKRFEETREPFCGSTDPYSAGNGSIMRLAPVPMFFAGNPLVAIEQAAESSRTTHGAQTAVDACRYMAGLIVGGLNGVDKSQLLAARYCPEPGYWEMHPLCSEIDEIAAGSFKEINPPEVNDHSQSECVEFSTTGRKGKKGHQRFNRCTCNRVRSTRFVWQEIKGSGYVVKSLEAALWAFYQGNNFKEGALLAVNMGMMPTPPALFMVRSPGRFTAWREYRRNGGKKLYSMN